MESISVIVFRDLLQLHHVHGGQLRGDHHHGPQLSPQAQGDAQHARLGGHIVPPVPALAPHDAQAWQENHQEDHHDAEEAQGAGQDGAHLQVAAGQCPGHGGQLQVPVPHEPHNARHSGRLPPEELQVSSALK